ncbi:hypothetical protein F4810DRAFT_703902 [Camillea tinctor]|nr:hypothetical protein F4810DRAFT_703902 [Camillea tinctor]
MSRQGSFPLGALLALLSGDEELGFRCARRRLLDILSLAPVSGLQVYLRDYSMFIDTQDREYISPYGQKVAPLRNIRVAQMITYRNLLADGTVRIYRIGTPIPQASRLCWLLVALSWTLFAVLLAVSVYNTSSTWIGKSNLIAFALWSVYLRVLDFLSFVPAKTNPSSPDKTDAAIFLGRRNSALIIEGCRKDVLRWTGTGLYYRSGTWGRYLEHFFMMAHIGTFLLLAFAFCTIPNGTTLDQIIFIAYLVGGQLNTWVGLRLHAHVTKSKLLHDSDTSVQTRTHVYAELLRRYQDGDWAEAVGLLPKSPVWDEWKQRVVKEDIDAKARWEECANNDIPNAS